MKKQASFLILGVILCLGFFSFWINFIDEPSNHTNMYVPVEVAEVAHESMLQKGAGMDPVTASRSQSPEPATLVLVGVGLVGFVTMRLSRERK